MAETPRSANFECMCGCGCTRENIWLFCLACVFAHGGMPCPSEVFGEVGSVTDARVVL